MDGRENFLKALISYNGQEVTRIVKNYNLNIKSTTIEERGKERIQCRIQESESEKRVNGIVRGLRKEWDDLIC